MPSTQDKRLPSVGTVFRSVDAFKLACFEVAASSSFRLNVFRTPSAGRPTSELRCAELATKKQAPTVRQKCRCVVKAEKRRDGSLVVEEVHRGHSCGFDPASPAGEAARREMERRLDALCELVSDDSSGEDDVDELQSSSESAEESASEDGAPSEEEEPITTVLRSGRTSFASRSSPTKDGVRARSKPEKPDDGKRAYLRLDDAAKSPYPTKRASRAEVAELVQAGDVELPTLNAPFPSSSAFFTRIWAYAEQRGFPVERDAKHGTVRFYCLNRTDQGRCSWDLRGEANEDGGWSLTQEPPLTHDCGCVSDTSAVAFDATSSWQLRAPPLPRRRQSSSPELFPLPAKRSRLASAAPLGGDSVPRRAAAHTYTLTISPTPPLSLTASFSAFFTATLPFHPPSEAKLFSTLLVQGGVSSTSDLADLLFFKDSSLVGFVDRVKLQTGVSDYSAERVKAMLREAKRVFTKG
ncbi:hypothetical protein JCM10213_002444 [Rhodosporidiobolus nylandii]